jgi:hypothetical protein
MPEQRAGAGQEQPFEQRLGEQLAARGAERAHYREIVAPLLHRLGQRDEHPEAGGRDQQQTDPAQRVDPDPDQRQQTRRLECGRRRLQRALLVDQQRQLHRGDR